MAYIERQGKIENPQKMKKKSLVNYVYGSIEANAVSGAVVDLSFAFMMTVE